MSDFLTLRMRLRLCFLVFAVTSVLFVSAVHADPPYLTGVVEDGKSQSIEMPGLPFTWQRQVEWLAPEGSFVEVGMPVVRIAPGTLLEQEELLESNLEEVKAAAALQQAQSELEIIDAEIALAEARTNVSLATLDSEIPVSTITQLNFDKAQLELEDARNRLNRAQISLVSANRKKEEQEPILQKRIQNAQVEFGRVHEAVGKLEIKAEQSGIVIYGENEMNALKINVGDVVTPGQTIATISRQADLQFAFWVHDVDVQLVQEGQRLLVTADALPDRTIVAQVSFVSNHATERNGWGRGGYFKVIASPSAPPPSEFLPGLAVSAELQ